MLSISRSTPLVGAGALLLLATTWSTLTAALDIDLCASINTSEMGKNISIYQTNGLCHDFCIDEYAYAITKENACWCSNFTPAKSEQESLSSCDFPCPAYPQEACGSESGLYGYIALGKVLPSGTLSSSPTSEAEPPPVISKVTKTVQNTVTLVPTESSKTTSTRSSSPTEDSSTTESASTETTTEPPTSAVRTVTADGTIKTVTIGPTGTDSAASDSSHITMKDKGLNTGEVVGIVVGIIAAVIIATGLILFFWFRRRKQNDDEGFQDDPSIRDSSSGMVAGSRPDMTMTGGSPVSPTAAANRNSTLQIDPRMDPFKQGLYVRSASHESVNTLRDDHDYSRRIQAPKVLRATNPDPEPGH